VGHWRQVNQDMLSSCGPLATGQPRPMRSPGPTLRRHVEFVLLHAASRRNRSQQQYPACSAGCQYNANWGLAVVTMPCTLPACCAVIPDAQPATAARQGPQPRPQLTPPPMFLCMRTALRVAAATTRSACSSSGAVGSARRCNAGGRPHMSCGDAGGSPPPGCTAPYPEPTPSQAALAHPRAHTSTNGRLTASTILPRAPEPSAAQQPRRRAPCTGARRIKTSLCSSCGIFLPWCQAPQLQP
jgi:hypothetical protein